MEPISEAKSFARALSPNTHTRNQSPESYAIHEMPYSMGSRTDLDAISPTTAYS